MSDLMLRGVILMPYEMAMRDELSRRQFYSRAQALLADYDRMREALAEIADYWNRDQNDQAMYDACWHAINTANAALAQEQGGSDA